MDEYGEVPLKIPWWPLSDLWTYQASNPKDVPWFWTQEQDDAFDKIKEAVTSAPVLKYFDSSKPTEGNGNASSQKLGFVLTQEDHPVTLVSRVLTQAEQRYSQIEKELLAHVFGLEHNHQYIYGRKVTLYTDHKPLVSISRKPLTYASKCLQTLLLLLLQQYNAEIKYRPRREMYRVDTLSRAYQSLSPTDTQRSETERDVESIHAVEDNLAISEQQLSEINQETAKDPTLQTLKKVIQGDGLKTAVQYQRKSPNTSLW